MLIRFLLVLCLITFVSARGGIGGRIAMYSPTSHGSKLSKLIKSEWSCDPFTRCGPKDFGCMLDNCPYNKTSGADCPNQIVGQYSSMCLQIGRNDLKQKIFLGKSYSLVLEPDVVANCSKYDVLTHFLSVCDLYRVNHVDESIVKTIKPNGFPYHQLIYHHTTSDILYAEKMQFQLMRKQISYNGLNIDIEPNDFRRIDFELSTPQLSHQFKVSTALGFSFTLPLGVTEKYTLPVYAELKMDLKVHDDCFSVHQTETTVNIVKNWSCSVREFFSF